VFPFDLKITFITDVCFFSLVSKAIFRIAVVSQLLRPPVSHLQHGVADSGHRRFVEAQLGFVAARGGAGRVPAAAGIHARRFARVSYYEKSIKMKNLPLTVMKYRML
jgi:hypothetical protein